MPKIIDLPSASGLQAADAIPLSRGGTTYQTPLATALGNVRTAAEISASVTPSNYLYPPGNVRRYGAVGNGSTDDVTAFQSAVNVAEAGGGSVYVPAGTYILSATVTSDSGSVEVYGDGDASVLKLKNSVNLTLNRLLYFNGCDSAIAHDLKFDGNAANNTGTSQALCEAVGVPIVKFYALTAVDSDTDGISVRNSSIWATWKAATLKELQSQLGRN
jgi:hypothetical protein